MTTLRQFTCDDLFRFNPINLDPLTETYGIGFYLQYLARWPEYFVVAEAPSGDLMGYIMGKAEGQFPHLLLVVLNLLANNYIQGLFKKTHNVNKIINERNKQSYL